MEAAGLDGHDLVRERVFSGRGGDDYPVLAEGLIPIEMELSEIAMKHDIHTIKGWLAVFIIGPLLLSACAEPGRDQDGDPERVERQIKQSSQLADDFQMKLQGALSSALAQGGAVNAIEVCHSTAPQIARSLSANSDAHIRRIAFKNRNAGNAVPDDLMQMYRELEANPVGEDAKPNSVHRETESGFVYMRSIPMQEQPCSVCHGTSIAPEVAAATAQLYPEDRAVGFQTGDLRGAFVVEWPSLK